MANSKNKCTNCKKYFTKESMRIVTAGKFHSKECLIEYGMNKTSKVIKSANDKQKKDDFLAKKIFRGSDLKIRKLAAKKACHEYIRARDFGKLCICCNRVINGIVHAGHYLESGNNPKIRYDEDNIHAQLSYCNTYKGGNSDDYRGNLIKKIGIDRVARLESMKGGTVKRSAEDYKEIESYYKFMLKELTSKSEL